MTTYVTQDLTLFKPHPANRGINETLVELLAESLAQKNLLDVRPILVDEEMRVVDGQHRLEAARRLGIPVTYAFANGQDDMKLLNSCQLGWKSNNFVDMYAGQGNPAYIALQTACKDLGITLTCFEVWMGASRSSDKVRMIRGGHLTEDMVWSARVLVDDILPIRDALETRDLRAAKRAWGRANFHRALYLLWSMGGDLAYLADRILACPTLFTATGGMNDVVRQLAQVYNYNNRRGRVAHKSGIQPKLTWE